MLDVSVDGHPIELRAAKHRTLVAALVLHPNQVGSADRLVEVLWTGAPPASALNTLQGYVSHVRKLLGGDVIVTRAPGYLLAVELGQIDAARFERLVAAG